jgi:hypothetical protein
MAGLPFAMVSPGRAKGPDGQGLRNQKEDEMSRIITQADLQGRSLAELQTLYRSAYEELVRSESGSPARRDALASVETVSLAMARRRAFGPGR